jgi:hypothetical protein
LDNSSRRGVETPPAGIAEISAKNKYPSINEDYGKIKLRDLLDMSAIRLITEYSSQ